MLPRSSPRRLGRKKAAQLTAQGKPMPFSTITKKPKPVKKSNPERQAKRRESYHKKLAAYKRSETYKVVQQRAAGRCEFAIYHRVPGSVAAEVRCDETTGLHHHHTTYARFGGDELPEDIQVLCKQHHHWMESQHPTRRHGR